MSEPYPAEQRRFGGEVVAEGARAPGSPVDPEADARGGGLGTGDVDPTPSQSEPPEPDQQRENAQRQVQDDGVNPEESARGRTCATCGSVPLPGGHCECSYPSFDAQNHRTDGADE